MLSRLLPESIARGDPRLFQIAVLSMLLAYGMAALRLDVTPFRAALTLSAAVATQYACTRLPAFDPRSALISGLSLCLLLRTADPRLAALVAVLAVSSKFLLRWNGKHVFNPTNLALVLLLGRLSAVSLELETLVAMAQKRYGVDLVSSWHENIALGELFERTRGRVA